MPLAPRTPQDNQIRFEYFRPGTLEVLLMLLVMVVVVVVVVLCCGDVGATLFLCMRTGKGVH